MRLLTRRGDEHGSVPIALIAVIVVAGIISVLTARTVAGERTVRFDERFSDAYQVADAGTQQGFFQLQQELPALMSELDSGGPSTPRTVTVDGSTATWEAERTGVLETTIRSTGINNGVPRTVSSVITERPLFFPGAFGDTVIALNGSSTNVDSYNSDIACVAPPEACGWGPEGAEYGTGNGAIGTNGAFDFAGTTIKEKSAFLYDWANPDRKPIPGPVTDGDPFGAACDGSPCTTTYVSTIDEELDYASDQRMQFIRSKLADCGELGQELEAYVPAATGKGSKKIADPLKPFNASLAIGTPAEASYGNYYCADSVTFDADTPLDDTVTSNTPVVIFVRDYVAVTGGSKVGCHDCPSKTTVDQLRNLNPKVLPAAGRLQIFVAAEPTSSGGSSNVTLSQQSVFAGVIYAPLSSCGKPEDKTADSGSNAGVDVFGSIICGGMKNVGNWRFHYDDALGTYGTGEYSISFTNEEPGITVSP